MLFKAIEFAAKAHHGQFRKQTRIPYIIHPLGVAQLLIEAGCGEEVVVAGLLHDTVEDTPATLADIEHEFGRAVADLVAGATEPDKRNPWEMRKQHTLDALKTASPELLQLICADKLHNLRSIRQDIAKAGEDAVWSRFSRPRERQRWFFEAILTILQQRVEDAAGKELLAEFEREVATVFGQ